MCVTAWTLTLVQINGNATDYKLGWGRQQQPWTVVPLPKGGRCGEGAWRPSVPLPAVSRLRVQFEGTVQGQLPIAGKMQGKLTCACVI